MHTRELSSLAPPPPLVLSPSKSLQAAALQAVPVLGLRPRFPQRVKLRSHGERLLRLDSKRIAEVGGNRTAGYKSLRELNLDPPGNCLNKGIIAN